MQVPHRLAWRSELKRLSSFNRRLMWAYHGFVGLAIAGFGTLTLLLHDEMLRGDREALAIVALMAAWWTGRILVDLFWYSSDDWPRGRAYVLGHAALVVAFVGMASTYSGVLIAHSAGALS